MAAWNSSSLAFSDHNIGRHHSGLMKNLTERISKQHLTEHKMFGSKRGRSGKDFKIGKKFKLGSFGRKAPKSPKPGKNMEYGNSSSISPSTEEFDRMMSSISKGSNSFKGNNDRKRMFQRKSFG